MGNAINMDHFVPRPYQKKIMDAFEVDGYKKILVIMPRRAGKDLMAWNMIIWRALNEPGVYYYCLPTYRQAKLVIWDSITNDGDRFLDYIPKDTILTTNSQELKIVLKNNSVIQLIGSDSYDRSLVGTNPKMIVFSEYALADERAYHYVRPILNANDGNVMFLSTPRGKNHLYELYNIAKELDDWYVVHLDLNDTKHISAEQIDKEIASGEISWDLAQQEYYCSWSMGVAGAYYAKYLDDMRLRNMISRVPWQPDHNVHTAWDIGVRDSTVIIFFQYFDSIIRIIDCYHNDKEGLEHYIKEVQNRPYVYGTHIAPHDMRVREFGSGMTRLEKAASLGISFTIAPHLTVQDGIEAVRTMLPKTMIDDNCKTLIKALEHYRQDFDQKKKVYKSHPAHTWESHFADAVRYLALSYKKVGSDVTPDDLEDIYRQAKGGYGSNLGRQFGK
jgi:phage terminase large subunit